ncbi:MAG TPA: BatD family protein [Vicinamibacteria bacterium]|nr:BatD family protein [Vicinamibacteria bacterium]
MRDAYRVLLLAACALAPLSGGAADDVRFQARVDTKRIGKDDLLQLTLTLEGSQIAIKEDPAPPRLQNLRVAGGPGVSTQLSIVNGVMTSSRTYTYVLQPLAVGPAEIGSARVKLESGEKTTAPIALEVVPGSVRPKTAREDERARDPLDDEDPFAVFRPRRAAGPPPKVFVEAVPSRNQLHVGEPLTLTYYLYTQAAVSDLQFGDAPQFPGFWVENLEKPDTDPAGEAVTHQGEAMRRLPVLRRLLFPTKAGRLTLPSVGFKIRLPRRSLFDAGGEIERTTKPVTITALTLPEAPGFSGAVGRFEVQASLDRSEVALGDAATLRIKVQGRGNLKWVEKGPEPSLTGAKVYPPQVKSEIEATPSGMSGSKTWEFVVVPETSGTIEIPRLPFSYFDPEARKLVAAETAPLTLTVRGAPSAVSVTATAAPASRPSSSLTLRADLDPPSPFLPRLSATALAAGLGLALVLHATLWGASVLSDRRRVAGHHAPRQSVRQALGELAKAGRSGLTKEAAAALIEKAIHEVFGAVDEGGAPEGERERAALAILREVQFIRYAPQLGDYSEKIQQAAARAAEVIRRWA